MESPQSFAVRALLIPKTETTLSSQIGARIEAIHREVGERFAKGDVLVEFDCAAPKAELRIAKAELHAAQLTLTANKKLLARKAISQLDHDVSKAKVIRSQAEVALRRVPVGNCVLKAPFPGRVVKRLAKPFQTVEVAEPVIELLDDTKLLVETYVPSKWLVWLKVGGLLDLKVDETRKVYPARLVAIGARVDSVSQTITLRSELVGQHEELLAGMSGVARFSPK